MNNTGKTITAITTAAAIGTGVLLTTMQDESSIMEQEQPPAQVEFVDDIKPISVPIFTVDIPSIDVLRVDVPKIEICGVEIPNVENLSPETITVATHLVEKIGVENLSPAQIRVLVTIVDVVDVAGYSIETIRIATQIVESVGIENLNPVQIRVLVTIVDTVDVAGYSIETVRIATQVVSSVGVENLNPVQIRIVLQTISNLDGDVPKIQALQKMLAATMKDQRMLQYDRTLSIYNEALTAWLEIYSKPLPPPIKYIPLPRGIRMIAELRSSEHAAANLAFYQKQGYNACLITIDGTESISKVLQLVNLVRAADMAAWIAWAGPEKLEWSIYQDPAKISRLLKAAAPLCDGYLVAWRRTSAHLVAQDAQYLEYLVSQVRAANPTIYVVGESYYGQTWENLPYVNRKGWEARDNVPRNQSGVLIAGIATQGYAVESMLRSIFARWVATPRLAMVLGEKAYYASTHSTGRSFLSNLRIKQQLERRFLRAGCIGTVTIHGDGSDRGSTLMTVDDLGKYGIE